MIQFCSRSLVVENFSCLNLVAKFELKSHGDVDNSLVFQLRSGLGNLFGNATKDLIGFVAGLAKD